MYKLQALAIVIIAICAAQKLLVTYLIECLLALDGMTQQQNVTAGWCIRFSIF